MMKQLSQNIEIGPLKLKIGSFILFKFWYEQPKDIIRSAIIVCNEFTNLTYYKGIWSGKFFFIKPNEIINYIES